MGNIIRGHTKCPICDKVIEKDEEFVAFPAVFADAGDFDILNDAAAHKTCFLDYPLRFQVREYIYNLIQTEYSHPLFVKLLDYIDEVLEHDD